MARLKTMLPFGNPDPGTPDTAPDFADGWYGYVSKDLRDLLAAQQTGTATTPVACRTAGSARRARRRRRHGQRQAVRCGTVARQKRHHRRASPAQRRRRRRRRGQTNGQRVPTTAPGTTTATFPAGAYSRIYCGNGSFSACRKALQDSLRDALSVTPKQIYGNGDCATDPQAECYDRNRPVIASAVGSPKSDPFQNRPTFQQVIEVPQVLPR